MRVTNSIKNTLTTLLTNFITILIGFIAQAIFIKILGVEYLGINGLFTNIISMLGIVELGVGSAIIYNLYKPIAEKDIETIKSLMNFYKKAYHLIALIIILLSFAILPFLKNLVGEITIDINIYIIYLLFVIDIVFSYLLSYKRSLLYANEQNYIINIIHAICLIILNILQLTFLYYTKNYYLYLLIKIFMRLIENIIITIIINKKYSYLTDSNIKKLDKKLEQNIFSKVKALFFHKIAAFIISGTDNIIISKFLGIITVGLYSNYYMIINAVQTIFGQAILALTPSIGNLLTENNTKKNYEVFQKVRFLNFWIATFSSIAILIIMDSFIKIWVGKEYILSEFVLIVLVVNFYQKMMRNCYSTFKEAAGIFYEDRFIPILESLLNITFSIILLKIFGLPGVFMGTIISGLALWCYSYPKYVYKKLFNRSYKNYIKETIGYILIFILVLVITYQINNIITINNNYLNLIYNIVTAIIIPNSLLLIIFYRNNNFKYYINLLIRKNKTS